MTTNDKNRDFIASIVAAYAARPDAKPDDIVDLARKLEREFGSAGDPAPAEAPEARPATDVRPALPLDQALTRDKVFCLCCGKGFKMLKRHLGSEHGLTEAQYRRMFGLSDDTPLVAPSYSERKAEYARRAGLGKHERTQAQTRDADQDVQLPS
ncbi:MucR family transcriptional regulator [Roseivivax isoporae]|uniref:MucR family transcriptional regulator n=1 Tax=Roseivivax isoporae LMG 25204 TaxID=1449351 RepID=X7F9V4_9RHOB|nr:MucR family transcriptional regulator [Roseivivax isoporae]ETX28879.1 MucR family transcriptional regulator [Roseivivax isoporae LMG 25204]